MIIEIKYKHWLNLFFFFAYFILFLFLFYLIHKITDNSDKMEKMMGVVEKNLKILRHMEFMGANPYDDGEIREFLYETNKRDPFMISKSYSINKYCMENCKGKFFEKMKSENNHFRMRVDSNKIRKCMEIIHNNILKINTYENNGYHKVIKNIIDSYLPDPVDDYDNYIEEEMIEMAMSLYIPDSGYFESMSLEDEILPWNILNLFSRFYDVLDERSYSLNEMQTMMFFKLYIVMKNPGMLPCFFKQVDIYHKCENPRCLDEKIMHSVYAWPNSEIKQPFLRNGNDKIKEICRLCNHDKVNVIVSENKFVKPYINQSDDYEDNLVENDLENRVILKPSSSKKTTKEFPFSYKKISLSPNSFLKKVSGYLENVSPSEKTHNLFYNDDDGMPKESSNFTATLNMLWLIEGDKLTNVYKKQKLEDNKFVSYKKDQIDKKYSDIQEESDSEDEEEEEEYRKEYNDLFVEYYNRPVNIYKMIKEMDDKGFDFSKTKEILDEFCLKFNLNIFEDNVFDLGYEEIIKITNLDLEKYDNIIFNINGYYFHALNDKEKRIIYVYGDNFKIMNYRDFLDHYSRFDVKLNLLHYNKKNEKRIDLLTRNITNIISNSEFFVF